MTAEEISQISWETFKAKGTAQEASTSATTLPVTAQPTNVSFQSLPKIDLPKFSGKFSDWENFRDVFRSIIYRREDLSLIMKLHYLCTRLTGEALEKIKSPLRMITMTERELLYSIITKINVVLLALIFQRSFR